MPYALSVILSRAIPEIDGLKPSHRKLLYTMYLKGLLTGETTKSANIVGETMKLNPHGDAAIYETMVRLTRGHQALLHPLVESKGNFGKHYSRDTAYAAARYTEAKLAPICKELFDDINKETVEFVPNYDNTMQEPTLFPVSFPSILITPNQGIAVGMASNICSFNLGEVCDSVIEYIKNPNHDFKLTMPAPDFSTGAQIVYGQSQIDQVYKTGKGSIKLRAKYHVDEKANAIIIDEIPYTTTVEAINDKIVELVKGGKFKEISDVKDLSDKHGLKLYIELKRGNKPEVVMAKLFKSTPLEDNFGCNFNILIGGTPRVLGVGDIIEEWLGFRRECIKNRTYFLLEKAKNRLHLLLGMKKILLDIDKAVKIVRETEHEEEVVPNLMIGFGIDKIQAEYIAEIKLRHLNREYILKRLEDISNLQEEIEKLDGILKSKSKIDRLIIDDMKRIKKQYGMPRKTEIIYEDEVIEIDTEDHIEDYAVSLFLSKESYFKKIPPNSLRMYSEQKFKEGDLLAQVIETTNKAEILFFTNQQNCYKAKIYDFADTKASAMGDYLPAKLSMENGENVVYMAIAGNYTGYMLFCYENGKAAKIAFDAYKTLTNRKRLINAYSDKIPLAAAIYLPEDTDIALTSTNNKVLIVNTALIAPKSTKNSIGVNVMTQKGRHKLYKVELLSATGIKNISYYRTKNIPAVGHLLKEQDSGEQQFDLFEE
ncbi:MAG: topoisomerase IV [Clostridia bacterium]|nr:topoisomerase IV [Clostridia bacterium]